jgi:NAD(P)H-dependent FMN reductase
MKEHVMPKTLIVYHSRTGYTRRVAQALARRLAADLEEIAGLAPALRPARRNPAAYDLVVIGTPVWFWSLSSPVRSWLEANPLRGKQFAFFCTMGSSGSSCVFSTMKQLAGGNPVATLALTDAEVGALAEAKLDSFVRALRTGRKRSNAVTTVEARAAA